MIEGLVSLALHGQRALWQKAVPLGAGNKPTRALLTAWLYDAIHPFARSAER